MKTSEDLISFEIAKVLKLKGFDWCCEMQYDGVGTISHKPWNPFYHPAFSPACTLSLVQKWLRDVKDIHVNIRVHEYGMIDIEKRTFEPIQGIHKMYKEFDTYEKALEYGLLEVIKVLPDVPRKTSVVIVGEPGIGSVVATHITHDANIKVVRDMEELAREVGVKDILMMDDLRPKFELTALKIDKIEPIRLTGREQRRERRKKNRKNKHK